MKDTTLQHDKGEIGSIFRTLHILRRKFMKECGQEHGRCDIHHSLARALHLIIAHGSVTMSDLHDMTGFERGSLTTIVDGLIDLGLVKRKRGENDRRKVFVIPTQKGISADNEAHREIERHMKHTLEKLSRDDRERFLDAMKTLEEIAEKL
jgi:DNA-binding MarR family transcriptional regulator